MATRTSSIVYIVDDDASLRRSIRNLLSAAGFRVETFESAEAFLGTGDREGGCLVLDLEMPGMGGLELLNYLAISGAPHPVIILTGHTEHHARQRSLNAGAFAFFEKPFDGDVLLGAVEQAVSLLAPTLCTRGHARATRSPVHFAGGTLDKHCHIGAFFSDPAEYRCVLASFVKDGIDGGEKTLHLVSADRQDDQVEWLRSEGIDVERVTATGQLEMRPWHEAYLRGDRFEQNAMIALIEETLQSHVAAGYPGTRLLAHMEWALLDKPGVRDLVEYEARVNYVLPKFGAPVICAYDLSKFNASVIMDVLRTHPMVIIGGVLQQNPFFVPPDKLLLELSARQSRREGSRQE